MTVMSSGCSQHRLFTATDFIYASNITEWSSSVKIIWMNRTTKDHKRVFDTQIIFYNNQTDNRTDANSSLHVYTE